MLGEVALRGHRCAGTTSPRASSSPRLLFPLTLPATDVPLWQVAVGISFGVVIGKELFGGVGKNFLNPALTGRAYMYFAYPAQLSRAATTVWVPASTAPPARPPLTSPRRSRPRRRH